MRVRFEIPGEPKGKGRPRFTNMGKYVKAYTPKETASYENLVKLEYQAQCGNYKFGEDAQLDMRITAYYSIPKSVSKRKRSEMIEHKIRPTKKPDMDNVVKIVADSLNNIAYKDDTQVVDCMVRKFYGEDPKVVVIIQEAVV